MKTIINFVPTGIISTKALTPYVPISITEIVEEVHMGYEQGISCVHLHIRDKKTGKPTLCAKTYGNLISKIRRYAPELIICISLTCRSGELFEKRIEPLFLKGNEKPDMASLSLSSMNFVSDTSISSPDEIKQLAQIMKQQHVLPELEVFDQSASTDSFLQVGVLREASLLTY